MSESTLASLRRGHQFSLSPTTRVSLGLVALLVGLLMMLDLVFKLLPDQRAMTLSVREQVAINMAVQVKLLLSDERSQATLTKMIHEMVQQSPDIDTLGVRRVSGELVTASPRHSDHWIAPPLGLSTITSVVVPLNSGSGRWGQLEVGYRSPWPNTILGWLKLPTVQLIGIVGLTCFIAFYLYLRRVLQHLDPSKAIPERVRVAFDTLTEGLLVLDLEGRILLANAAFRGFHPQAGEVLLGRSINQLEWLVNGVREESDLLPWERALLITAPIVGVEIDLRDGGGDTQRAVLNCTAIRDAAGNPRGCLLTLDDVTALDQANTRLRSALVELEGSRDKIQRQNDELTLLANCDPMTGCFNRRAFFARAEPMLAHALKTGEPLCCLMSDIDRFKSVNDTYGHSVGDLVIQAVSKVLKSEMREQDVLCRYGGEEFCVLLQGLTLDEAAGVAEHIRSRIEREVGPSLTEVPNLRITSSFGVAALGSGNAQSMLLLIERADQGLYVAKECGRNQVQCIDWSEVQALRIDA